jgi:hypothetical protein
MATYTTRFGSLDDYDKGGVELINDKPSNYVFSNMFEVAAGARPWEKVAVAKNMEYVLEVIRAEGTSPWRVASHDEFALVVDGEVTIDLLDPDGTPADLPVTGSVALEGDPPGTPMGRVVAGRGHMALLPAGRYHRYSADRTSVILLQTIEGRDTVYRWADICQTT